MRKSKVQRKTSETDISAELDIDGSGKYEISTTVPFFDHLLSSFSKHGRFDLKLKATGDNQHHIVEDVALVIGEVFSKALGDKKGIQRFGHSIIPMDEVLLLTAVDLSGRNYCVNSVKFRWKNVEGLSAEMIGHFLESFSSEAKINLHTQLLAGKNEHHKAEALFKSLGISLMGACRITGKEIPSTKGVI